MAIITTITTLLLLLLLLPISFASPFVYSPMLLLLLFSINF